MSSEAGGWFKGAEDDPFFSATTVVEDAACRAVLRAASLSPGFVLRNLGEDGSPAKRLTFNHLVNGADFLYRPAVTGDAPDDVMTLMTKFKKSRLYRAWIGAWDDRPDCPLGTRVLVFRGPVWGISVMHDGAAVDRPILLIGHQAGLRLAVEPIRQWCRAINWGPEPDYDDDKGAKTAEW